MRKHTHNRREFLQTSAAAAGASLVPYWLTSRAAAHDKPKSANDCYVIGCIGTGDRWQAVGPAAGKFGDIVAVCDVDRNHVEKANARVGGKAEMYEDYRKLLDRKDIDVVTIVTPDHWHTKIAIDALRAGKDVYCEKPLTLTIEEGKLIRDVLKETGRVFQVGTQQRSEMNLNFLKAVALVRDGRIGKVHKVTCAIGGAPSSPSLPVVDVPSGLNWDMWLGQAPLVDYVSLPREKQKYPYSRCHYEFRWWYEYSGGKMTDWGAHHVDIAHWALGADDTGPTTVKGTADHPKVPNGYNVATSFFVTATFADGVDLIIRHDTENGILIEGEKGRIFVSRGSLKGKPVEELESNPLPEDAITRLYKGKKPGNHMRNFFDCIETREQPMSDVYTHHRAMTTCHLANIAIRLGRTIKWDPEKEQILGDDEARAMQSREQRKGYEITV